MTYATTFSGIGGWELGLNACGWQLRWQCERDPWCRGKLKERFGVPVCPDISGLPTWIRRTFGSIGAGSVDVLIGSPPCQPFSVAGSRSGTADSRHLYPAFICAVRILRPRWVLMENVPGLLSDRRAFGQYIGGLAALGFDCVWHCIPAVSIGANHRRDRVWIIANATGGGIRRGNTHGNRKAGLSPLLCKNVADSDRSGPKAEGNESVNGTADENWKANKFGSGGENVANASGAGRKEFLPAEIPSGTGHGSWSPDPKRGNWKSEPGVGRVANGIPNRAHRLKALGNAVVPQIPFLIGQSINSVEGKAVES